MIARSLVSAPSALMDRDSGIRRREELKDHLVLRLHIRQALDSTFGGGGPLSEGVLPGRRNLDPMVGPHSGSSTQTLAQRSHAIQVPDPGARTARPGHPPLPGQAIDLASRNLFVHPDTHV